MSAVVALLLGVLAAGYAVWPWLKGVRGDSMLDESPVDISASVESDAAAFRDWSVRAGELSAEPNTLRFPSKEGSGT